MANLKNTKSVGAEVDFEPIGAVSANNNTIFLYFNAKPTIYTEAVKTALGLTNVVPSTVKTKIKITNDPQIKKINTLLPFVVSYTDGTGANAEDRTHKYWCNPDSIKTAYDYFNSDEKTHMGNPIYGGKIKTC
jgi:hypothetical protein